MKKWNNWFELFETAIGNIPKLTDKEKKITKLQSPCVDKTKNFVGSYDTISSHQTQAIFELIHRCGNLKLIVAAFNKRPENFERLNANEPQIIVKFTAFLRKLVHSSELNNLTSDLSSYLTCSL